MTDVDQALSRLGSQCDLYLHLCRNGAGISMVIRQIESLLKVAEAALTVLRDADPYSTVELEAGLSDAMRFHLETPAPMDGLPIFAPDDISSISNEPITDEEALELDTNMIYDILGQVSELAVLVTNRPAVEKALGHPVDGDDWERTRSLLKHAPQLLTTLIADSFKEE